MVKISFEKAFIGIVSAILLFYCYQMILSMNDSESYNSSYFILVSGLLIVLIVLLLFFQIKLLFFSYSNLPRIFFFWFLCVLYVNLLIPTGISINTQTVRCINILIPVFIFFGFYLVFKKKDIVSFYLKIAAFFTLALAFIYYQEYNIINIFQTEEKALNIAYFPFLMLPTVLCLSEKKQRIFFILLIAACIFSSMKRGGLIAFFLSIIVFYIVDSLFIKGNGIKVKNILYVVLMVFTVLYSFLLYDEYNQGGFMKRLEMINEDKGSGREGIYEEVINLIAKSEPVDFVFGHGDDAVSRMTSSGYSAHNDFLEILYSYGFLAFIVYVFMHFSLIATTMKLIKMKSRFAAPFALSYIQFLVFALVSHVIVYTYFVLLTAFWGIVIGTIDRESRIKIAQR